MRRPLRGFSLIELMVSMAIGLVILGALFTAFGSTHQTSRTAAAVTQMTEDATLAMNLLRSHVRQAGYSRPTAINAGLGRFTRAWSGRAVFGCDGPFADLSVATPDLLSCGAPAAAGDVLALVYEVDAAANGNALVGADGRPLDCLGNGIPLTNSAGGNYHLSYSRFYLAGGGLSCRGPGNAAGQILVDHVTDLQVLYGLAAPGGTNVVRYATATQMADEGLGWDTVLAVRLCLVVRSAEEVLGPADTRSSYLGCDPFAPRITATDRRLYRAFTTTVSLQNRL